MYSVQTITGPATLSVSTQNLHDHLRLNDTTEDALLTAWLTAAVDLYQQDTREVLTSTAFRLNLDNWPCQYKNACLSNDAAANRVIYVSVYPVTSVASVEYLDTTGTWQT